MCGPCTNNLLWIMCVIERRPCGNCLYSNGAEIWRGSNASLTLVLRQSNSSLTPMRIYVIQCKYVLYKLKNVIISNAKNILSNVITCYPLIQCNYARTCYPVQERFIQRKNVFLSIQKSCYPTWKCARNVLYNATYVIFDKKHFISKRNMI